jgi:hypothetical protein
MLELYLHSPICLHGMMLNYRDFTFFFVILPVALYGHETMRFIICTRRQIGLNDQACSIHRKRIVYKVLVGESAGKNH